MGSTLLKCFQLCVFSVNSKGSVLTALSENISSVLDDLLLYTQTDRLVVFGALKLSSAYDLQLLMSEHRKD